MTGGVGWYVCTTRFLAEHTFRSNAHKVARAEVQASHGIARMGRGAYRAYETHTHTRTRTADF